MSRLIDRRGIAHELNEEYLRIASGPARPTLVAHGARRVTRLPIPNALRWNHWVGKPDGTLIRHRCRLFGHRWWLCDPDCCGPRNEWCDRCLVPREPAPIVAPDKAMPPP